ncbi:MAG: alpha-glucan family phosphorylase [Phycisphaerae bacterium]
MHQGLLAYDKLDRLTRNLWWTWHPQAVEIFRSLDAEMWREVNHNPRVFLERLGPDEVQSLVDNHDLGDRIDAALGALEVYCSGQGAWASQRASRLRVWPVGYFSAEFGLHESLPMYAGGLGVLAGDHLKSCSDLGVPIVGIGLLYTYGYFHQRLDTQGMQQEEFNRIEMGHLPIEPVMTPDGKDRMTVEVPLDGKSVRVQIWLARVGRASLYLLDSNLHDNDEPYRTLTGRLYKSDPETRIQQEIVLGVGGMRTLAAVQRMPGTIHLNEGHCAFALLEMMRLRMVWEDATFDEARDHVGRRAVFTTHTPVPAGHDAFRPELVMQHLRPLQEALGLSEHDFLGLGRVNPDDAGEPFGMTVLGLRVCHRANGVSALHGRVSRRMWRPLWGHCDEREVPIGHITNGVHVLSWLAPRMYRLYERYLGESWHANMTDPETWQAVADIPDEELWKVHQQLKTRLVEFARRRIAIQRIRRRESEQAVAQAAEMLDDRALTLGFARRFAGYKRADLIFSDSDRLARLLNDPDRPVQLIFAGKAHPADGGGKETLKRIFGLARDPAFAGRVVLIEDYDIGVARHLVQGVDVWLNNPVRPLEASGTSGQKVLYNGGLNFSILDGWWWEAYDGQNGFAIGYGGNHPDPVEQTRRDAQNLYETLEQEVVSLFYQRDADDLPRQWLARMKWTMTSLGWRFNSDRMVLDYFRECYIPAAGAASSDFSTTRRHTHPL